MNTSFPPAPNIPRVIDHNSRSDHFCFSNERNFLIIDDCAKINWIIIATIYALGAVLAIVLNLGFLIVLRANKRLQKLSNYLLALLSFVDLLMAFAVMPGASSVVYARINLTFYCDFHTMISVTGHCLGSMSFIAIILITAEQFLAICFPYFHGRLKMHQFLIIMILASLILCIWCIVAWHSNESWGVYETFIGIFILTTFTMIIYCYIRVFMIARRTVERISSRRKQFTISKMKQRHKAAKTSLIVLTVFTICYIPLGLATVYRMIHGPTAILHTYIYEWAHLCCTLNATLNPLVYFLRLKLVRRTVAFYSKKLFMSRHESQQSSRSVMADDSERFL